MAERRQPPSAGVISARPSGSRFDERGRSAPRKLSEKSLSRRSGGSVRFLRSGVGADADKFSAGHHLHQPWKPAALAKVDVLESTRVVCVLADITVVLLVRGWPQVAPAVALIGLMVDLIRRPLAFHVEPREPMGEVDDAVDPDPHVASLVGVASERPDDGFLAVLDLPAPFPGLGVVAKQRA